MNLLILFGSLQTYEMTFSISQKPKDSAFKASKNEEKKKSENSKKGRKRRIYAYDKTCKRGLKISKKI